MAPQRPRQRLRLIAHSSSRALQHICTVVSPDLLAHLVHHEVLRGRNPVHRQSTIQAPAQPTSDVADGNAITLHAQRAERAVHGGQHITILHNDRAPGHRGNPADIPLGPRAPAR